MDEELKGPQLNPRRCSFIGLGPLHATKLPELEMPGENSSAEHRHDLRPQGAYYEAEA